MKVHKFRLSRDGAEEATCDNASWLLLSYLRGDSDKMGVATRKTPAAALGWWRQLWKYLPHFKHDARHVRLGSRRTASRCLTCCVTKTTTTTTKSGILQSQWVVPLRGASANHLPPSNPLHLLSRQLTSCPLSLMIRNLLDCVRKTCSFTFSEGSNILPLLKPE